MPSDLVRGSLADELLSYRCDGVHYIVRWNKYSDDRPGPVIVVARSSMRGKRWIRAVRKISGPGWWISAYHTKREAVDGFTK